MTNNAHEGGERDPERVNVTVELVHVAQEVGATIHQLMWRQRITQAQLGEAIGVGQTTAGRKVRGDVPITVTELVKIARLLGVEPGELLPRLDSNQQPCVYASPQVSAGAGEHVGTLVDLQKWRERRLTVTTIEAAAVAR